MAGTVLWLPGSAWTLVPRGTILCSLCRIVIGIILDDPAYNLAAGEEFNRENATLDEEYERAVDHVEFFVDWIWGISKKNVGVTNFLIREVHAKTSKYSDQRHKYCIMGSTNTVENAQPSKSDSTDVLRQLTEGVSRQNERIEETNNLARQEFYRKKEKRIMRSKIECRSCIPLFLTCW